MPYKWYSYTKAVLVLHLYWSWYFFWWREDGNWTKCHKKYCVDSWPTLKKSSYSAQVEYLCKLKKALYWDCGWCKHLWGKMICKKHIAASTLSHWKLRNKDFRYQSTKMAEINAGPELGRHTRKKVSDSHLTILIELWHVFLGCIHSGLVMRLF